MNIFVTFLRCFWQVFVFDGCPYLLPRINAILFKWVMIMPFLSVMNCEDHSLTHCIE